MDNQNKIKSNDQAANYPWENSPPTGSWREIMLAILPYLLVLLIGALPMLLTLGGLLASDDARMRYVDIGLTIIALGCLLAIFVLAWRHSWPLWSATWILFFCIPALALIQALADSTINQESVTYVWIPLFIAVLLFTVTRLDPLRGLLAALPVIYLLWLPNMESVADGIELVINVSSIAIICLTIAYLLRRGDWRTGLYAILAMNLAVGTLYAYAGIYHGGMLPSVAPGPNLVELLRSLIPQYLATSAILLGLLFAWKFRQVGHSVGRGGKIAYHIALTGLLVVIMANLGSLASTMEANSYAPTSNTMATWIIIGLGIYLVGVVWLFRYKPFPRTVRGWAEIILLSLLPLGIPIILIMPFITWIWPVSNLYGIPLLWTLPHTVSLSIGLLWLGLSVWVVTRGEEPSGMAASFQTAIETPVLSL